MSSWAKRHRCPVPQLKSLVFLCVGWIPIETTILIQLDQQNIPGPQRVSNGWSFRALTGKPTWEEQFWKTKAFGMGKVPLNHVLIDEKHGRNHGIKNGNVEPKHGINNGNPSFCRKNARKPLYIMVMLTNQLCYLENCQETTQNDGKLSPRIPPDLPWWPVPRPGRSTVRSRDVGRLQVQVQDLHLRCDDHPTAGNWIVIMVSNG